MKKSVSLLTFIAILVISYTSASAQVTTTGSSLSLQLTQGTNTPSGAALLTSGGLVATATSKIHVAVLPVFAQPSNEVAAVTTPFSVGTPVVTEKSMAEELNIFIAQERALKQRGWFRKKK